ncbi:hypothetical protein Cgig2_010595 [Carnegiea gigantea]|uniref:Protein SHORTAGE IN CHIASMATA 1 n=1 Tax=Carnegiea gigantea TaxID=171969 RepID=A0A9Q1QMZ7_9CARY|nr:hypothetical protein Cgig2_010595 [Carnegiea gigantea]
MRTQFLTTDYFNTNQTLTFLRLPLPHIQPPPIDLSSSASNLEDEFLRCVDCSSSSVSLQLDSFPIDNALSTFFSNVLPHTIDAGACVLSASLRRRSTGFLQIPEKGSESSDIAYEETATETCVNSDSENSHERTKDSTGGENENVPALLQLEIPELDEDLENACMAEKEKIQLLLEVQACDDNLEMLSVGLANSYGCDVVEAVDTVKATCLDYDMEQKPQIPEEFSPLLDNVRSCDCVLPLFEVDEMGMEDPRWACVENELHSFIESIEVEHCTLNDDLELNCQCLLGSTKISILELIDDHHISKLCLDLESLNSALDVDILQVVETPTATIDAYLLEEFEMLDSDFSESFEAHSICQNTKAPETCHELFHGDTNFKSFDDLIVNSELAVINDSFISLPVPALKDDEKTLSLQVIITGVFPKLEPVPLSASDEIYLDWHLLGEDKCNINVVTAIEKVFSDVQESTIDLSQLPNDGSMLMLDLLLLDDPLDCLNVTQNKIDMPSGRSCTAEQETNVVASSSLSDDECQIIENTEKIAKAQPEKATLGKFSDEDCQIIEDTMLTDDDFGKQAPSPVSMSHFNDLDFFLNPRKAMGNMKMDRRLKAPDDNSALSNGLHKRKAAPPIQMQQLHVQLHTLSLPTNFIVLIDNLRSSFLAVFDDDRKLNGTELSMTNSGQLNLLGLSEESLMEHMTKPTKHLSFMGHGDDNAMDIVTLCAIKLTEVEDSSMFERHPNLLYDFFNAGAAGPSDHLKTGCLLLSHEDISPSILMQKFDMILEYGGPSGISKVSTLSSEQIGARSLHFLEVGLDGPTKALCEGITVALGDRSRIAFEEEAKGSFMNKIFYGGNVECIELEDMLNFGSIMENQILGSSEAAGRTSPWSRHRPVSCIPEESKNRPNDLSFANVIIVINTQNSDKDMIMSRRSTYQKILTLEKRGGQVVERDLILPVDIVLDATTCVAWYDCKNIASKTIAQDEGSPSIPICIENIAANVLTSLSFVFTACILIFEGESNFLGSAMESADELYVAAAGLGIHLQIFCSYSAELTDEIILGSIGQAMKFSEGLLPRLRESETLAESFLTKFPSINPLSAHAIISSGCTLLEFLELSPEGRIQVLRKYHVPEESINLLSVLCKYGELEGSKSGLTDCSSSISSPPDSKNVVCKISSEDRKRKFVPSSFDSMYDSRCPMPSSKITGDRLISLSTRRPLDSELSKGQIISSKSKLFNDEVFVEGGLLDSTSNKDPSNPWWRSNVAGAPKNPQLEDGFTQSSLLLNDRFLDHQEIGMMTKTTQWYNGDTLRDLQEDLIDKANIYSKPMSDGDFQAAEQFVTCSPFVSKMATGHAPKHSRTARRLSFGGSSYPTFPSAEEMNMRYGLEDDSQLRVDGDCMSVGYNWSNSGLKPQKEPMGGSFRDKSTQKFSIYLSKENDFSSDGETPLSKAINSGKLQQGSPWTIDFLNRIKEKRRLMQQHQPFGASAPSSSYREDINRVTKRRSPSILEFYKYRGGSTPSKVTRQQKRQKQDDQPVNDKPTGLTPTWTPTDKRARRTIYLPEMQTLSFATSGTRGQAKLVWRDNVSGSQRSRFSD